MQAVADDLDCAVGTIYTYFSSKAELLTALQGEAVTTLVASYRTGREMWDEELAGDELEPDLSALVHLQAFGAFVGAAAVVFADEFALQRALLSERPFGSTREDLRLPMTVLERWFQVPAALVDDGVDSDALEPGNSRERVVRWLAALNGLLLLDRLTVLDRHLFRASHHARSLTGDLLVGWGAERTDVDVAASYLDRLSALGPLAPPPTGPGFD